jgi:hydroxyacylglutathione hydrolase
MLEDDFTYVLRKALRGHDLSPAEAARRSGLLESEVDALIDGNFHEGQARRLAPVLGLAPGALARHPTYLPAALDHPRIHRLELPFGSEHVNAWLISGNRTSVLFDTGRDPGSCAEAIRQLSAPPLETIFITHAHPDHVGGISDFTAPAFGAGIDGAAEFLPDQEIRCGPFLIRASDLSGHASPALGFHVGGLDVPVLVTGDALFAGSIGGCPSAARYRHALERLRAVLAPLPDDTILLPGHGPATILGEEKSANPFLAMLHGR